VYAPGGKLALEQATSVVGSKFELKKKKKERNPGRSLGVYFLIFCFLLFARI
jgi:hypothetical protein